MFRKRKDEIELTDEEKEEFITILRMKKEKLEELKERDLKNLENDLKVKLDKLNEEFDKKREEIEMTYKPKIERVELLISKLGGKSNEG